MTPELSDALVSAIAVFARVGGFILILPAFSSAAVPAQVRILMVAAISLPLFGSASGIQASTIGWGSIPALVLTESLTGVVFGALVRLFFLTVSFVGEIVGSSIGLAGMPGISVEAGAAENVAAALINWIALVSFLLLDLHHVLLRAIAASYDVIGVGELADARVLLVRAVDTLTGSFALAARLGSPFLAFGLIANFIAGLLNKLVPQIPAYFVTMPAIVAGGLLLLFVIIARMIGAFEAAFDEFLAGVLF